MLVTVYMRMARNSRGGVKSECSSHKPSYVPLTDSIGEPLPTAFFALNLEVPDELFDQAEQVLGEISVDPGRIGVLGEPIPLEP